MDALVILALFAPFLLPAVAVVVWRIRARYFHPAIHWNPWNKVVCDHRTGTIHRRRTNRMRKRLGLPVPWTPAMADAEIREPAVWADRW